MPTPTRSAHTPGPWTTTGATVYGPHSTERRLHVIADVAGTAHDNGRECLANARLIAAAPEMLDLLKKAALFVEADVEWHGADALPTSAKWLDKARALLARLEA